MAEAVVFGIAQKILIDLGSVVLQESVSAIGVKKELKRLETTVSAIKAVLLDAEDQHVNNHEVRTWLRRIKDAAYDADDILDDFATEALKKKLVIQDSKIKMVRNFVSISNSTSFVIKSIHRIKEIRETLEEIADDKNKFQFMERSVDMSVHNKEREQTHSFVVESEVFGRKVDKEKIVSMLMNMNERENVSVIPIQGMGGLGKTTLAQLVYNDKSVDIFELKMWVCVAEDFDVEKITKKIIEASTKSECPKLGMDLLQSHLREQLEGKKFLLVLDDIWNENDEKWYKLKCLLIGGARGSKIIVTTRSDKVATIMGTIPTYHLMGLSNDDCWNLFKHRAFSREQNHLQRNLVVIGKEIVRKCGGVPLAAKALGSLMRFKTDENEWTRVRDNDIWRLPQEGNGILPALKLSYNHLPFYLRQCFAYCSIFPKDHRIEKEMLIQLWIAQGFVHSSKNQFLEDVGDEYIKDLLWRSFFQEPVVDYCGNLVSFKMHDLVHDLAQSVAGIECSIADEGTEETVLEGLRHLCFIGDCYSTEILASLRKTSILRTLVFQSQYSLFTHFAVDVFSNFRCLRVLILRELDTQDLPSSVGNLKHLRYLEVCSKYIEALPKSVTKLLNLQTLKLSRCYKLKELPSGIGKMINLRHIDVKKLPSIPTGIGKLNSLRTLSSFFVGKGIGCKLNELQGLVNLRGELSIENLECVTSDEDSKDTHLHGKQNLQTLKLLWNEVGDKDIRTEETSVEVLGTLQPHSNLKRLEVTGYVGRRFPNWMLKPFFPNLVQVSLSECRKCQNLPPFGVLPSLQVLKLDGMDTLQFIEGSHVRGWFSSLKVLDFKRIPELVMWVPRIVVDGDVKITGEDRSLLSLPSLIELNIRECPKLTTMPLTPSLEKLYVGKCTDKLLHSVFSAIPGKSSASIPSSDVTLKMLTIEECHDLVCFSGIWYLAALQILHLRNCKDLRTLEGIEVLTSLRTLEIEMLPKLISLPEGIDYATTLQYLSIEDCEKLVSLPKCLGNLKSLQKLKIWLCPMLQSVPDEMQHLTTLQSLKIEHCFSLTSWPSWLGNLISLSYLSISCSSNLPSLPEQLKHLTALRTLCIQGCGDNALPKWLGNFTSLERLYIYDFPKLEYLPEWMPRLSMLRELRIRSCDLLISRCSKYTGEDWHKIEHVPWITIQEELI